MTAVSGDVLTLLPWLILLTASLVLPIQFYRWWRTSRRVLFPKAQLDQLAAERHPQNNPRS